MKSGQFCWVLVEWTPRGEAIVVEWQPARFTGSGDDGLTFDFIGFDSASGHHHVEVREIGRVIEPSAVRT